MAANETRPGRNVEVDYPAPQLAHELRRLADCIEQGKRFQIQVGGNRISVPPTASINVEHELRESREKLEFQLVWKPTDR